MVVSLYNFNGKQHVANKIKGLSPVKSWTDLTTYNQVNSLGMVFVFKELIECNYCKYVYNGIDYYGYVRVDTKAKDIYSYTVQVDPLATAYYRGCMETDAYVEYCSAGDSYLVDPRLTLDSVQTRNSAALTIDTPSDAGTYYALVVTTPYSNFWWPNTDGTGYERRQTPTNIHTYILNQAAYNTFNMFLASDDDEYQKKFANTMLGIYALKDVPVHLMRERTSTTPPPSRDGYTCDWNEILLTSVSSNEQKAGIPIYDMRKIKWCKPESTHSAMINARCWDCPSSTIIKQTYTTNESTFTTVNEDTYNADRFLVVPYVGSIPFKLCDVISHDTAVIQLGYNLYFDFVGKTLTARLLVNETEYPDFTISAPITEAGIIQTDQHVENYGALWANAIGNIANAAVGFGTGNMLSQLERGYNQAFYDIENKRATNLQGLTARSGNLTPNANINYQADFDQRNLKMNYNEARADINQFRGNTLGTISALNSMTNLMEAYRNDRLAPQTQSGSPQGNMSRVTGDVPKIIMKYHAGSNRSALQTAFGKPLGKYRSLIGLTGFIKCQHVYLLQKGLPLDLITEASKDCCNGYYVA